MLQQVYQVYQRFDVDFVAPASRFIKNETMTKVFYCEFWEFFSLQFCKEEDLGTNVFLWILRHF